MSSKTSSSALRWSGARGSRFGMAAVGPTHRGLPSYTRTQVLVVPSPLGGAGGLRRSLTAASWMAQYSACSGCCVPARPHPPATTSVSSMHPRPCGTYIAERERLTTRAHTRGANVCRTRHRLPKAESIRQLPHKALQGYVGRNADAASLAESKGAGEFRLAHGLLWRRHAGRIRMLA